MAASVKHSDMSQLRYHRGIIKQLTQKTNQVSMQMMKMKTTCTSTRVLAVLAHGVVVMYNGTSRVLHTYT